MANEIRWTRDGSQLRQGVIAALSHFPGRSPIWQKIRGLLLVGAFCIPRVGKTVNQFLSVPLYTGRSRLDLLFDLFAQFLARRVKIVACLKINPEFCRMPK